MKEVKCQFIDQDNALDRFLILKIFQNGKKFKYTIQNGDGPNGRADVLNPWAESEFKYNSIEEAEDAAECTISETAKEEYESQVHVYDSDDETGIAWGIDGDDIYVISWSGPNGPWESMDSWSYNECKEQYENEVQMAKSR